MRPGSVPGLKEQLRERMTAVRHGAAACRWRTEGGLPSVPCQRVLLPLPAGEAVP